MLRSATVLGTFFWDLRLIVTVAIRCGPHTCWGSPWEGWRGSTPSPSPRPRWPRLETTPVSQKTALAPSKSTLRWILVGFNICGGYNMVWQVHGRPTEATFERAGSKSGHRSFQLSWKVWCLLTHIFRLSVFLGFRVIIVFFLSLAMNISILFGNLHNMIFRFRVLRRSTSTDFSTAASFWSAKFYSCFDFFSWSANFLSCFAFFFLVSQILYLVCLFFLVS